MPSSPDSLSAAAVAIGFPSETAGYAPRYAEANPYADGLHAPARLVLHAVPAGVSYAVVSFWEERLPGAVTRTTIEKKVHLTVARQGGHLRVAYAAAPPVLRQPDLSSFERVLLLLAELYQRLELRVTPAGQIADVLNGAEVRHTWERVRQELVRRSGGGDEFTQILMAGLDEQLRRPGALLASLRLDYFFGFLLPNVYEQRFESGFRYGQARCFPQFFAGQDLWFGERLELAPPTAPERVALRLRGQPDPARTNLAAVARQLDAARRLLAPDAQAATTPPQALCLAYEATAELDAATGWPVSVEASVRCGVTDGYGKEYFIRLEQLPAS